MKTLEEDTLMLITMRLRTAASFITGLVLSWSLLITIVYAIWTGEL
jgi:hypothetical protein